MEPSSHGRERRRVATLAALACLALLVGVMVYVADRPASQALLIPAVAALAGGHFFGALGQWLPSFVHPFAFSLLTAAVLPVQVSPRYGACVAWCLVNVAFEVGQHPAFKTGLAEFLHGDSGQWPPAHALANYLLRGTFDLGDIAAVIGGTLAAAAVLHRIHRQREPRHAR